ncbi:hypothetical protein AAFF_G00257910 [Aldrovandia affinis]|uniref:Uncharacterized protein n=1 Tax=Aldrovandia affinis TaxID=143900 RepID=A0AAD7ST57_9TELE|nr:hypothetical protein AAFF_G00257910 [Aldrovandia affinis]
MSIMTEDTSEVPEGELAALSEDQLKPHSYPVLIRCCLQDWASQIIDFQLNGDPRLLNYCTTYADHFQSPPSFGDVYRQTAPVKASKDQQGEKLPDSTHKSSIVKHSGPEDGRRIQRYRHSLPLRSAYRETYQFRWCPPPKPVMQCAAFKMGDPEIVNERETTYNAHFKPKDSVSSVVINQTEEHQLIHLGNWSKKWQTTASDAHSAVKTEPVLLAKRDRNFSSVPRGDVDPERNRQRMTATTYKLFFHKKSLTEPLVRIDGPSAMTRSNVMLGQVGKEGQNYATTASVDYPRRAAVRVLPFIPVPGYGLNIQDSGPNLTTMKVDYPPVNGRRNKLNPEQLEELKSSHIAVPSKAGYFTTSYEEFYAPKPPSRNVVAVTVQTVSHMPF